MGNATEHELIEKYKTLSQHFTKYGGVPLYTICLYGTVMNMIMFGQCSYRHRSGSLYLLVASLCDFIYLNIGPLPNILQYGFQYNWTISSINFCKIKSYLFYVVTVISATLTSLANLNQCILSSKKHKRWKYSSKRITIRCIVLSITIWFLISIPVPFCYTRHSHSSDNEQLICSIKFQRSFCYWIHIFYICIFNGFLHPTLMVTFGLCTYRNIHHIQQRSLLKSNRIRQVNYQMTLMLVLQSIKSSLASVPYAMFNSYLLITMNTKKSLLYQAKENMIGQILYFLFWSNYTSFFVYVYSSSIFKDKWKELMKKLICCLYGKTQRKAEYEIHLQKLRIVQSVLNPN